MEMKTLINPKLRQMIVDDIQSLIIPEKDVAYLYDFNSLMHGLLVLTSVNYAMIPVLKKTGQMVGLLNITMIIQEAMTLEDMDMDNLEGKTIDQIELRKPEFITQDEEIDSIIYKLLDNNFVCVVNDLENKEFIGIITRNAVLKRLNALLHNPKLNEIVKFGTDLEMLIQKNSEEFHY